MSCYITYNNKNYTEKDFKEYLKSVLAEKQNTSTEIKTPGNFINHSGGAYGADTMWDQVGREFGVIEHKHYREGANSNLSQKLKNSGVKASVITKEELEIARTEVEKLLGKKYPDTVQGNLQVRNYYQVANADSVFAIAPIENSDKVSGGTNTAVQLGIKMGKPVYVWDTNTEKWFTYSKLEGLVETPTPTLTKNFAGVGTRNIENYNTLDKTDNKWKPRKEYLGDEKSSKAQQAIRDVYEKTFNNQEIKPPTEKPQPKFWTRESVAAQPDKIFLFGDNFEDAKTGYVPSSTQAVIRGLPNAIGISTKFNRRTNTDSFMDDSTYEEFKEHVDKQIETAIELAEETGKTIIVPENGIGTGKAQLEKRAPKSFAYLKQELDKLKNKEKGTPTPPKQTTVITPEMIRARVKSSFDKNGYMDIKEENRGDKVILGAITRYIMATKGITTNNQIIEANKTFKLKDEVTLETVREGVLRIKIKEDIVEETPKPLGGLNMSKLTSSGESMANDALSNVEQAFKCK